MAVVNHSVCHVMLMVSPGGCCCLVWHGHVMQSLQALVADPDGVRQLTKTQSGSTWFVDMLAATQQHHNTLRNDHINLGGGDTQ